MYTGNIAFIDAEIDYGDKKIVDIGAVRNDGQEFHSKSVVDFTRFIRGSKYICGHNIIKHDLTYLTEEIAVSGARYFIDTLYMSPLLFPIKPYHRLVKDDKIVSSELNNPLSDAK
jgi:ATP-dependent DNA helicase RecQ